jgi:TldD protein
MRALCADALDAAVAGGASYADARAIVRRDQLVATRGGRVIAVNDQESEGIGVRVLVGGAWGFACSRQLSEQGAGEAARRACGFARAAAGDGKRELAPVEARSVEFRPEVRTDPFGVSVADKVALCLGAEEAMRLPGIVVTSARLRAFRERKLLLTTDGVEADQERVECGGGIEAVAAADGVVQSRSYPAGSGGRSAQSGWEYVDELRFPDEAPRVGEEAVALTRAPVCPSGRTTVVLDADQVVSQLHESVGHPTELDRIHGTEAAYAGTSFLSPADLGTLRYGSELMNVTADATLLRGLGSFAVDDERLNFQFGTELAREIRNGKLGRLLRDATYTGITPPFWSSLDAVAGPEEWVVVGIINCGKGQPGQVAHVSHGASPARFRDVQVGVRS